MNISAEFYNLINRLGGTFNKSLCLSIKFYRKMPPASGQRHAAYTAAWQRSDAKEKCKTSSSSRTNLALPSMGFLCGAVDPILKWSFFKMTVNNDHEHVPNTPQPLRGDGPCLPESNAVWTAKIKRPGGCSSSKHIKPRHKRKYGWMLLSRLLAVAAVFQLCQNADAQCSVGSAAQPVTVDDETTNLPNSRQLVNGTNSVVDTSTAGQIKVDVSLPNSGVTAGSYTNTNMTVNAQGIVTAASNGTGGGGGGGVSSVNPGTETTIGGTSSAPTVNVQFAVNSTLTANTSLTAGTIFPCDTSAASFTVTLPDATASGNKGTHIVVFLKTAGHALSVATTSSQLINGQSAPISVSNANTFLLLIADGTNWQCMPMQPATGQTTNQWVAYIDALGVQHTAQIAFSNLSGSATAAQMLSLSSGQIYVGNSSSQPQATTPTAGTGLSVSAGSGSLQYSLSTPISVANGGSGTSIAPTSGQLLIGTSGGGYSVANLTAGSNVTITNSSGGITIASSGSGGGVSSVNAGTETTIGGTGSAPTVNVQFAVNSTLTANTSMAVGTIYPCNTSSSAFTVTLPDATSSGNKGAHIVVFLKTAGNALSVATTSSQLINGQSAPISVSNVNSFLHFVSDGTNWQCVPMQPATGQTTNQWVAYIDALGVQHTAQIAFSNLSGTIAAAQMPALSSGQIYVGNSSSQPAATTPTAGTGLSVSAGSGSLQYSLTTPISVANGGTGTTTAPTSGQLLIGTSGGGYSVANLSAGSNVTITNSSGGVTIAASAGSGSPSLSFTSESSSFTATAGQAYIVSATATCTLPTAVGVSGQMIVVINDISSGTLTFNTTSSQTIGGLSSGSLTSTVQQDAFWLVSDGSNWRIL